MDTIRQQILQTIAQHQPISARSVTERLGVKHETVKMTISKLFAEGKISREEVKRPLGSKGKTNHYEYKIK
jgi:predicted ArsR family transcriptional regulator